MKLSERVAQWIERQVPNLRGGGSIPSPLMGGNRMQEFIYAYLTLLGWTGLGWVVALVWALTRR